MKLFNHVQIKVSCLEKSQSFYDAIMAVLGYSVVLKIENVVTGYGTSVYDMFEIRQTTDQHPLSKSVHLAFNAPNKEAVQNFYQTAIEQGATCNGKPNFRPEYEKNYYAAFIIDRDGNNIEVVFIEK